MLFFPYPVESIGISRLINTWEALMAKRVTSRLQQNNDKLKKLIKAMRGSVSDSIITELERIQQQNVYATRKVQSLEDKYYRDYMSTMPDGFADPDPFFYGMSDLIE
jgi:hypothetical protein